VTLVQQAGQIATVSYATLAPQVQQPVQAQSVMIRVAAPEEVRVAEPMDTIPAPYASAEPEDMLYSADDSATGQKQPQPAPKSTPNSPKRGGRKKKDPNAPASASSAYTFFFKDNQASIKEANPEAKFGEVSKIVSSMWAALDKESRAVYEKRSEEDRARHDREMAEYEAKASSSTPAASRALTVKRSQHGKPKDTVAVASLTSRPAVVSNPASVNPADVTDHACIRAGCGQNAIRSPEWEDEYCSNACVVAHCKDVFKDWVSALNGS